MADLGGSGQDVPHPLVRFEWSPSSDTQFGELAIEGPVLVERRLIVQQVVQHFPELDVGLPRDRCEVGTIELGEVDPRL